MKDMITIKKIKTGYIIRDENDDEHAAETPESIIHQTLKALGLHNNISSVYDTSREGHFEKIPKPKPKTEPTVMAHQKIKELVEMKKPDGILIPKFEFDPAYSRNSLSGISGLLIPKFEYDPAQKKEIEGYSNISVVELPDGRAMIQYKGAHYYTTKEKVMQNMPYPIPKKHFAGKGFSSVAEACLRAYRYYLHYTAAEKKPDWDEIDWKDESGSIAFREHEAAAAMADKPAGSEDGTCDDVTFESCANNSPENCKFCVNESRYEDKNKLAAKKPAPPLMRASVPP